MLASDVRSSKDLAKAGPFIYCDVTDKDSLSRIVLESGVTHIVHLASLLSAIGEKNPQLTLRVNSVGIQNVLDVAASNQLKVRLRVSAGRWCTCFVARFSSSPQQSVVCYNY